MEVGRAMNLQGTQPIKSHADANSVLALTVVT